MRYPCVAPWVQMNYFIQHTYMSSTDNTVKRSTRRNTDRETRLATGIQVPALGSIHKHLGSTAHRNWYRYSYSLRGCGVQHLTPFPHVPRRYAVFLPNAARGDDYVRT